MQLDIDRLVAYFGGVNALAEALKQHDRKMLRPQRLSTNGVHAVPRLWLSCKKLTALAEAQGRPLDLNAFYKKTNL